MPLAIARTPEQAFLALVIRELGQLGGGEPPKLSGRALQHVLYLLAVAGLRSMYRFAIGPDGPFSEDIVRDLDWLVADDVVVSRAVGAEAREEYGLGPNLNELLAKHHAVESLRSDIRRILESLDPLQPRRLELLVGTHYAYQLDRATGSREGLRKARVADRVKRMKGETFSDPEIGQAYDSLAAAELIET